MLKEKIFIALTLCAGLFLFTGSDSYSADETIVGYPYLQPEGNIDYATLVAAPDNLTGVLFIGELSETSESFRQCFLKGTDRELELVITGTIVPYDSPYHKKKLIFDEKTTCSTR